MKRNENIKPLSRDHHFGLLFCWKIRRGLKLNVDPERINRYIQYYWNNHLRKHFTEEENILFIPREDAYCRKAIEEHRQIEQLVKKIGEGSADATLLEALAQLTDHHIRFEERHLFPYLEENLKPEQLNHIGTELQRVHTCETDDHYEDEFWVVSTDPQGDGDRAKT